MDRPLISLCLIVGNVEAYIERCLKAFTPIADEICMVRAIGALEPDCTIQIAEALDSKVRWSEYRNKPRHKGWLHLDDFAAARNQSFEMAKGEYIFWCDTDDVLQCEPELVREIVGNGLADQPPAETFICPYEIFGQHVTVPRERIIRRGIGKWILPVHEHFKFDKDVGAYRDDRIVVRHLPFLNKLGSVERNLRIMNAMPESEITPGMRYHKHCELIGAGRKHEAFLAARDALEKGGLGRPETYQLEIHLATFSTDPHTIESYLIAAYQTDPCRREALGLLAGHSIDTGQPTRALAFARQMMATAPPVEESWNDRRAAYGWLGFEILQQALRANNEFEEAERIRKQLLIDSGGPMISLIHATRGRPKKAAGIRKLWLDLAENPGGIEHIFVIDDDDEDSIPLFRMHHVVVKGGGGCVAAWNTGAGLASGKVLIQMSDDWIPPPRWDALILERFGKDLEKPRVLAISDGTRTDKLLCMAICTRIYYGQDWFMFHPDFLSVFSDNYFTDMAYLRGQVIEARDLVFKHENPYFDDSIKRDLTFWVQNSPERYSHGEQIYSELRRGRDWSHVDGWFNFWPFYKQVAELLKDGDEAAEIGVWFGRSIIYLAQACRKAGKQVKFYAIDTFQGELNQPAHQEIVAQHGGNIRKAFEENIKRSGVADMITILEGDSVEMARQIKDSSLQFCFIDANHDRAKSDIDAWLPKVKGTIAGHDWDYGPVRRDVKEVFPDAIVIGPVWMKKISNGTTATIQG